MAFQDEVVEVAVRPTAGDDGRGEGKGPWGLLLVLASVIVGLGLAACNHERDEFGKPIRYPGEGPPWELIFGKEFDPYRSVRRLAASVTPGFSVAATGDGSFDARFEILSLDASLVMTPSRTLTPTLDLLAGSALVAIRVPHEPPTYTVSSISGATASFYYFDLLQQRTVQRPITLTRRVEYEGAMNQRFPITDGRSHWETWWLPPDGRLPIPPGGFRNPQVFVTVGFSYPGGGFAPCPGCTIDVVLSNGGLFLVPFEQKVDYYGYNGASQREGLAQFASCGFAVRESVLLEITPGSPFTVTHCLQNNDTLTHTYDLRTSSSQGWDYTYLLQTGTRPEDTTPLTSTQVTLAGRSAFGGNTVGILAVYTPTAAISPTVQETFAITATSPLSPTQVTAHAQTLVFGVNFDPTAGAITATRRAFLPMVARHRQG